MPWIPLASRDPQLQDLVDKVREAKAPKLLIDDFYNTQDYGLLDSTALSHALNSSLEALDRPPVDESDAFQVRSLSWLRSNAQLASDRRYAEKKYQEILFDLWRKHVAETGDTYYPNLRDDLLDHYKILNDPSHN